MSATPSARRPRSKPPASSERCPEHSPTLERAREAWQALRRPLEAARCELLLGQRLLEGDREAALLSLERAAREYDELGVAHLAGRARELAGHDATAR